MHPDEANPTRSVSAKRLVAGGDALGHLADGRIVFATGLLPGETARVDVVDERRDFVRAVLTDRTQIDVVADDRVEPSCRFRRAGCGGCDWMHLAHASQVPAKLGIVEESLRRIGRLDDPEIKALVRPGESVDPIGYRTTIRLAGAAGGGAGFRRERSDDVIGVDHCEVAHPGLAGAMAAVDVAPGVELTLRTSVATGAITARWELPRTSRRRRPAKQSSGRPVDGLPPGTHIGDRAFLFETVAARSLRVSAPSFFQSGPQAAELLVDAVGRAAPEARTATHAADLYGGVGLFAATVLADAEHVTLVESSRSACHDAGHNLEGRPATVVRSEVGVWTPDPERPIDLVVADPARPGLARPGVAAIVATGAPVVVLVSCDPVSMARDLALLAEEGYRPESVEVVDLAPQTHHVETITRLVRA